METPNERKFLEKIDYNQTSSKDNFIYNISPMTFNSISFLNNSNSFKKYENFSIFTISPLGKKIKKENLKNSHQANTPAIEQNFYGTTPINNGLRYKLNFSNPLTGKKINHRQNPSEIKDSSQKEWLMILNPKIINSEDRNLDVSNFTEKTGFQNVNREKGIFMNFISGQKILNSNKNLENYRFEKISNEGFKYQIKNVNYNLNLSYQKKLSRDHSLAKTQANSELTYEKESNNKVDSFNMADESYLNLKENSYRHLSSTKEYISMKKRVRNQTLNNTNSGNHKSGENSILLKNKSNIFYFNSNERFGLLSSNASNLNVETENKSNVKKLKLRKLKILNRGGKIKMNLLNVLQGISREEKEGESYSEARAIDNIDSINNKIFKKDLFYKYENEMINLCNIPKSSLKEEKSYDSNDEIKHKPFRSPKQDQRGEHYKINLDKIHCVNNKLFKNDEGYCNISNLKKKIIIDEMNDDKYGNDTNISINKKKLYRDKEDICMNNDVSTINITENFQSKFIKHYSQNILQKLNEDMKNLEFDDMLNYIFENKEKTLKTKQNKWDFQGNNDQKNYGKSIDIAEPSSINIKRTIFCSCKKTNCSKYYCLCLKNGLKCDEKCICVECSNLKNHCLFGNNKKNELEFTNPNLSNDIFTNNYNKESLINIPIN